MLYLYNNKISTKKFTIKDLIGIIDCFLSFLACKESGILHQILRKLRIKQLNILL